MSRVFFFAWLMSTCWLMALATGVTRCVDGPVVAFYAVLGSICAVSIAWLWFHFDKERRRRAGEIVE